MTTEHPRGELHRAAWRVKAGVFWCVCVMRITCTHKSHRGSAAASLYSSSSESSSSSQTTSTSSSSSRVLVYSA